MDKVDNKDFLWYGLYAFAGFGLEILLSMIEKNIFQEQTMFSNCIHLIITTILWGLVSYLLYKKSKDKLKFNVINNNKVNTKNVFIAIALIIVTMIMKYFVVGGFKVITEFQKLGVIQYIFQNIYYIFEVILILLSIVLYQKFCDNLTKKELIPFGGILLGCTWGLMHILTQDFLTGMFALVSAIIYGIIYLLFNKNTKITYLAILFLFII